MWTSHVVGDFLGERGWDMMGSRISLHFTRVIGQQHTHAAVFFKNLVHTYLYYYFACIQLDSHMAK